MLFSLLRIFFIVSESVASIASRHDWALNIKKTFCFFIKIRNRRIIEMIMVKITSTQTRTWNVTHEYGKIVFI